MSRILKRPMFRKGGYVNSENTGITSGLLDKYESGGRVGFADGPSYLDVISSYSKQFGTNIIDPTKEYQRKIDEIEKATQDTGYIDDPSGLAPIIPGRRKTIQELELYTEKGKENFIKNLQKQREAKVQDIVKTSENLSEEQRRGLFDYYGITSEDLRSTQKPNETIKKTNTIGTVGGIEQPTKSDLKTVYEDLLPLFKKELGASEDEFSRQKYLELAKFGLNLLRQPAGPIGGKANIFGAAAAAAEKPLEAYGAILAKEKQAERLPKALALEAAMKEAEPGSIGKAVKDLQKLGISKEEAIRTATQSGTATREQTYEGVVKNIQESLIKDGVVTNANAARGTAEDLLIAEKKYGIRAYQFEPFPKDKNPVEGNYYIMKNGQSGRYYKGSLIKPGEQGFVGSLTE